MTPYVIIALITAVFLVGVLRKTAFKATHDRELKIDVLLVIGLTFGITWILHSTFNTPPNTLQNVPAVQQQSNTTSQK